MKSHPNSPLVAALLRWSPVVFLLLVLGGFAAFTPAFLSLGNLDAILVQSSWLFVVALGMNFVLLTAGVDLSVGATMYIAAAVIGEKMGAAPSWVCLPCAVAIGTVFGTCNGLLVSLLGLPPFIVTLSTAFVGRGIALYVSDTRVVLAGPAVSAFGRSRFAGVPAPLLLALAAMFAAAVLMRGTPFGPYVRAVGADARKAQRAGVPRRAVVFGVYLLSGAFAGLAGFVSFSQTSTASAAFGTNAEFSAIAAAVLGGTSLFGGRGGLFAPIIGGALIMVIQNGLVMMNANPYTYAVITGAIIALAALTDSLRSALTQRLERRRILVYEEHIPTVSE